MTERIHKRLSDFKGLPYDEIMAILGRVINGFEILSENYGLFKPKSSMIGFNSNGLSIKVWHNSNLSTHYPEFAGHKSKAHLINDLIKCVEMHGVRPEH